MRTAIDTNILVYATDSNSPWQAAATSVMEDWRRAGTQLCLSVQVLREYLAVVTRPAPGQTLLPDWAAILGNLATLRTNFIVLEDTGRRHRPGFRGTDEACSTIRRARTPDP